MTNKIKAQKREGANDTIHLYRDSRAYCDRRRKADPDRPFLELDEEELSEDYIMRNLMVAGKVCTNCRKAYQGVCHANE